MSQLNVVWATFHPEAPNKGYWCTGFIEDLLIHGDEWNLGYDYVQHESFATLPDGEGAVVVVPAEYNVEHVDQLNTVLARLPWVVLLLVSDERSVFNPINIVHPNMRQWVMTPNRSLQQYHEHTRFIPEFAPRHARTHLRDANRRRIFDWSFSGQVTHVRRQKLVRTLRSSQNGKLIETEGFAQGLSHADYYQLLANTRIAPAPSGTATLDSFRAFEALEAGCVPVLDLICPVRGGDGPEYWHMVLGDHPLDTAERWHEVHFSDLAETDYAWRSSEVFAWWQQYKRQVAYNLIEDVRAVGGPAESGLRTEITAVISTSPIESHPSLEIIEETINSIRQQPGMANVDIIVTCDGLRPEQAHRRIAYDQYIADLLWACNHTWTNVVPVVHQHHVHQANTTRSALRHVKTPLILYVEHDTPLVVDEPIDWHGAARLVKSGEIDILRYHFEAFIPEPHRPLMLDAEPVDLHGVPVVRTVQFSQRPHVARTDWYAGMLDEHFPHTSRTFIEDKIHGAAQDRPDRFRIAIYHPVGGNIKRSLHTDGRGSEPKYEMWFQ